MREGAAAASTFGWPDYGRCGLLRTVVRREYSLRYSDFEFDSALPESFKNTEDPSPLPSPRVQDEGVRVGRSVDFG